MFYNEQFLIWWLCLMPACGGELPQVKRDPALWTQVESFVLEGWRRGVALDASSLKVAVYVDKFAEGDDKIGECTRAVGVNSLGEVERWQEMRVLSTWGGWGVVYHELGHCLLDLEHSESPADLMYPLIPVDVEERLDAELDKMFKLYKSLQSTQTGSLQGE